MEGAMQKDERDLLDVLKFELNFLDKGGYGRSVKTPWRPQFIFEDSPTCMNYDSKENKAPCSDCVLMQLVPPEGWSKPIPCRHIPFNAEGETLESLYAHDNQYETEEVVGNWLRETIAKLEAQRASRQSATKVKPSQPVQPVHGIPLHQSTNPKCANPACPTVFHWLIGGKFFRFSDPHCESNAGERHGKSESAATCAGHCVKHFWLCESCCNVFTLTHTEPEGVTLKLLWSELPEPEAAAAAQKMVAR
jgi:hypothetical protein